MSSETKYLIAEATPVSGTAQKNVGAWKSGLFDCFEYGACHKALCCACCFPTLLMGQLLTRMKMSWLGEASSASEEYKKTFRIVVMIVVCNYIINWIFSCKPQVPEETDDFDTIVEALQNGSCPSWQINLTNFTTFAFSLYTLIVMIRLRMAIRAKYSIPEKNCEGCEDCCTVFFCGCCSAVQMAHQTANYENERAMCLTSDGLPPSDGNELLTQAIIV